MKSFVRRNPAGAALLVLLCCVCAGTLAGGAFGTYVARSTAESIKRTDPGDPRDGLAFVALAFTFIGLLAGAGSGLLAAAAVYFTNRRRGDGLP